jgi:hypothetical protein
MISGGHRGWNLDDFSLGSWLLLKVWNWAYPVIMFELASRVTSFPTPLQVMNPGQGVGCLHYSPGDLGNFKQTN